MKTGKITAKLRDAVIIRLLEDGKERKQYKNIELPDALKELEVKDFEFDVPTDGRITFKIHYAPGILPQVFPAPRAKMTRAEKAAAKATSPALTTKDTKPAEPPKGTKPAAPTAKAETEKPAARNTKPEAAKPSTPATPAKDAKPEAAKPAAPATPAKDSKPEATAKGASKDIKPAAMAIVGAPPKAAAPAKEAPKR